MVVGSVVLTGGAGFCNAVRRALLSDVMAWAPCTVTVRVNTSCQTDEYVAHRIGLIPFRRVAEGGNDAMTLFVQGPGIAHAGDLAGPNFVAQHPEIEVMLLGPEQSLDLTVHFNRRPASAHARYNLCGAVGMQRVDGDGRHRLRFDTLDGRPPMHCVQDALDALERRVDDVLLQLAQQPPTAPRSMC
jgi:hypothetical protein